MSKHIEITCKWETFDEEWEEVREIVDELLNHYSGGKYINLKTKIVEEDE